MPNNSIICFWLINGNLTNRAVVNGNSSEYFWDESNRLRVVNSDHTMQHYIYDASGERVLKASSQSQQLSQNGQVIDNSITWNNYTTYPSAFIVVDADGRFSKHYYAGTQRISSQMGATDASIFEEQQTTPREGTPQLDWAALKKRQTDDLQYYLDKAKRGKATFKAYKSFKDKEQEEDEEAEEQSDQASRAPEQGNLYFYHPDHLGTATYLTDINGLPYQFFLNLPFGESMAEQHSQTEDYESRWKFNGKEFDKETGLYYYGARYYDPRISIWASVDPMAEKFPNWNPYNYVMQNPLNLIDPTGMEPEGDLDTEAIKRVNVVVHFGSYQNNADDKKYNDVNRQSMNNLDKSVIRIENVKNIDELKEQLALKVGNNKIGNLIILTHGTRNFLQLGEDEVSTRNDIIDSEKANENLTKFQNVIKPYLDNSKVAFTACFSGIDNALPDSFKKLSISTKSNFYFDANYGTARPDRFKNSDIGILKNPIFPNNARSQKWNVMSYLDGKSTTIHSLYFTNKGNIKRSPLIGRG